MKTSKQLVLELKKLNAKLDQISLNSRFLVYSATPWKFVFYNFLSGIFHSLGVLFGTVVIAAALVYIYSQLHIQSIIEKFIQNLLPQTQQQNSLTLPIPENLYKFN